MTRLPGKYTPNAKNRSSKNLIPLTKFKPVYRCMNNEFLTKLANEGNPLASKELNRRDKVRDRNQLRKQKYVEKIAAKRKAN